MRKIGFIGGYDKTDFLISLAKILTGMNSRVLIIDATIMQKARYVVPTITPEMAYITTFERTDVAVGYQSEEMLAQQLGAYIQQSTDYDIALIDVDTPDAFYTFNMETADQNFFATGFDMYSMRRGLEALTAVQEQVSLTKILFSKNAAKQDEQYFNYLAQNYPVIWSEETIYFMCSESDNEAFKINYRNERIRFKNLSSGYKLGLATVLVHIFPDYRANDFLKMMKSIDKA